MPGRGSGNTVMCSPSERRPSVMRSPSLSTRWMPSEYTGPSYPRSNTCVVLASGAVRLATAVRPPTVARNFAKSLRRSSARASPYRVGVPVASHEQSSSCASSSGFGYPLIRAPCVLRLRRVA